MLLLFESNFPCTKYLHVSYLMFVVTVTVRKILQILSLPFYRYENIGSKSVRCFFKVTH